MTRRAVEVAGLHHGEQPIPVACRVGGVVASGGIPGIDRSSGALATDPEEQVRLVFDNLRAVLAAAGSQPEEVVKLTFYVRDRSLREAINREWVVLFPDPASRPARHTLVQPLPPGVAVQCEFLAVGEPA